MKVTMYKVYSKITNYIKLDKINGSKPPPTNRVRRNLKINSLVPVPPNQEFGTVVLVKQPFEASGKILDIVCSTTVDVISWFPMEK